jgi:acyl-CoA thioesterase II
MASAVQDLLTVLDLEQLEVNLFRGRSPQVGWQRVYGGQVIGQALVAACRTVDVGGRPPHSLHAYFLLPGDPKVPIIYEVDRIRDGKSFTTRRVVAIQHGEAIFILSASFQHAEEGPTHGLAMPDVPAPESLPTAEERIEAVKDQLPRDVWKWMMRERPIDTRSVTDHNPFKPVAREPRQLVWIRASGSLPDDPLLHQTVVAYASDLMLLDTATLPHAIAWNDPHYVMASLDHAMWFHRPFRADAWLLYAQESPAAHGARGFTLGHFFTRDGVLVASVAQEGLIRPVRRS